MKRIVLVIIFLLGLTYLLWPGPSKIEDFPPLPDSLRSDEPGDTIQNPDNAAFFSNLRRKNVISFYKEQFSYLHIFGIKIPPLNTNHPPEEAFTYIRDQQVSTYLEQFSYPLRDSLFVNGFEPFDEQGKPYREGATDIFVKDAFYLSKTTLHYYASSPASRVIVYVLIWVSIFMLYKLSKKAIFEK
jgi:hypothetical protein